METPQIGRQQDSSVGDKEDFGIYTELRGSDTFRTSFSYIGHRVRSFMMYHSLALSSYARRVLHECTAKGSNQL